MKNVSHIKRIVRGLTALLVCGFAATGASGTAAAVSFNSSFFADRFNTVGTTFTNMTASASTFCYLSGEQIAETDTAAETARCLITRGPIVWTLQAILGASSDESVMCDAICYNN